jgi:hypothetical protein
MKFSIIDKILMVIIAVLWLNLYIRHPAAVVPVALSVTGEVAKPYLRDAVTLAFKTTVRQMLHLLQLPLDLKLVSLLRIWCDHS